MTLHMTEAQWQQRITNYCDHLHLRWHHETDSRRSKAGFPDLTIVGPGGIIWVELKVGRNQPTAEQAAWLQAIRDAGGDARVWRPDDWPEVVDALKALAQVPVGGAA